MNAITEIEKQLEELKKTTANCTEGTRAIAVLDRGWIFAGKLILDTVTKTYTLTDCVNVRKWQSGGFGALTKSAKSAGATLDKCEPIKFHVSALIMAVPISEGWADDC